MFDSNHRFFTGAEYTGEVLFLVLALGAPLAAIYLANPVSPLYVLASLAVSLFFGALAFAQWKWRSQLSIPAVISSIVEPPSRSK